MDTLNNYYILILFNKPDICLHHRNLLGTFGTFPIQECFHCGNLFKTFNCVCTPGNFSSLFVLEEPLRTVTEEKPLHKPLCASTTGNF